MPGEAAFYNDESYFISMSYESTGYAFAKNRCERHGEEAEKV